MLNTFIIPSEKNFGFLILTEESSYKSKWIIELKGL